MDFRIPPEIQQFEKMNKDSSNKKDKKKNTKANESTKQALDDIKHFKTKICEDCDELLIQIGNKYYSLHNKIACNKLKNMFKETSSNKPIIQKKPISLTEPLDLENVNDLLKTQSKKIDCNSDVEIINVETYCTSNKQSKKLLNVEQISAQQQIYALDLTKKRFENVTDIESTQKENQKCSDNLVPIQSKPSNDNDEQNMQMEIIQHEENTPQQKQLNATCNIEKVNCDVTGCNKQISCQDLKSHKEMFHNGANALRTKLISKQSTPKNKEKTKQISVMQSCFVCKKKFLGIKVLMQHMKTHSKLREIISDVMLQQTENNQTEIPVVEITEDQCLTDNDEQTDVVMKDNQNGLGIDMGIQQQINQMIEHMKRRNNPSTEILLCGIDDCNMMLSLPFLKVHQELLHARVKCPPEYDVSLINSWIIQNHRRNKRKLTSTKISCDICKEPFSNKTLLNKHMTMHHNQNEEILQQQDKKQKSDELKAKKPNADSVKCLSDNDNQSKNGENYVNVQQQMQQMIKQYIQQENMPGQWNTDLLICGIDDCNVKLAFPFLKVHQKLCHVGVKCPSEHNKRLTHQNDEHKKPKQIPTMQTTVSNQHSINFMNAESAQKQIENLFNLTKSHDFNGEDKIMAFEQNDINSTNIQQQQIEHLAEHGKRKKNSTATQSTCVFEGNNKQFKRDYMSCHQKRNHCDVDYFCTLCDAICVTKQSLNEHLLEKHQCAVSKSIKAFPCQYCNESFSNRILLKLHVQTHNIKLKAKKKYQ